MLVRLQGFIFITCLSFLACSTTEAERREAAFNESRKLTKQAQNLYDEGQIENALGRARQALEEDPYYLEAVFLSAKSLTLLNRPDEAFALLLKPYPSPLSKLICLEQAAALAQQVNQPSLAVVYLNQAIDLDPDNPHLFLQKGYAEALSSREMAAKKSFEQALTLGGDKLEILPALARIFSDLGQYEEAEALIGEIQSEQDLTAEEKLLLGLVKCQLEKMSEGIQLFKEASLMDPDMVEAPFNLGRIYEKLQDLKAAELSYRQAL